MTPDELAAKLRSHPFASLREPLMQRIVLTVLRHAQLRTPVRFGTLRRSLTTQVEPGGLRGYIGTNLQYGLYVHEGTRFLSARPFLKEGIEDSRADVARILQASGDDYFDSVVS